MKESMGLRPKPRQGRALGTPDSSGAGLGAPPPAGSRGSAPGLDPTRNAAFALLTAVADQRRSLEDALDALPPSDPRDRAAAHRLAAAVLRHEGTLDAVLEPFLTRDPPAKVRTVLRIGAAGLLFLDTPRHAAVGTAVALARHVRFAPFAALVNAVLRRVADASLAPFDMPRLDTPAWLWTAWGDRARAIATAHAVEAPLDLTLRPGAEPPPGAALLPGGTARLPAGTRVTDLPGFADGAFWVQDVAATLPARLLAARAGERVADLCAAPGGKTAQLCHAGAFVTSVDRDGRRLARLRENMARLRLSPDIVEADIADWRPEQPFDAVLLDAPCSATGTARRHPDVLRLRRPRDIATLADRQLALLDATAALLAPGGRLVYAVCSLQGEEGPGVVARALAAGTWRLDPIDPAELPGFESCLEEGALRTHPGLWPDRGGMDGFYAARLIRQ